MAKNHTMWVKYFLIFILVSLSFTVIPELLKGRHSFSVLEIAGDLVISIIFMVIIFIGFKYMAVADKKVELLFWTLVPLIMLGLSAELLFLGLETETPAIRLTASISIFIGILVAYILFIVSIWLKSWVPIVVMGLIVVPDYLLSFTTWSEEIQGSVEWLMVISGTVLYFWFLYKDEDK